MADLHEDELPLTRLAWARQRWHALVVLALTLPLAYVAIESSLYWRARVFPGFFVAANRVVPVVGLYDWTGREGKLPPFSRVNSAGGRRVRSAAEVYDAAAQAGEGEHVHYEVEAHGQTLDYDVKTMRFRAWDWALTFGLFIVNGFITIGAGVAVALLQPSTPASKGFLAISFLSGLFMLSAPTLYHPWWNSVAPLALLAQAFWGAGFLHLGLVFPVVRPAIERRPVLLLLPYALSAALGAWVWHRFYVEPPDLLPLYVSFIYVGAGMLTLAGLFTQLYRSNPEPVTRMRLRLILPGLVISCGLACFGFLENAFVGLFPINLAVLFPVFFYLAVAYAIVRHDLFDIDRFVRQAAIYTSVSLIVTAGYAVTLAVLGGLPAGVTSRSSTVFNVAFVVLVAVLFDPLRTRVQRLIDRAFFRARVDYRHTVGEVSAALTAVLDLDEILSRVSAALGTGLAPSSLAVVLWTEDGTRAWRLTADGLVPVTLGETRAIFRHLVASGRRTWRVPSSKDPDGEQSARDEARASDASLVVPLVVGDRVIGAFLLGGKRSGLPYGTPDRELLETLAAQSAIAIENALLFGEVTELNRELEGKVQRRTAELEHSNVELRQAYRDLQSAQAALLQSEKMASLGQLTAGLAHEINTPVTAVVGNVKPLWNEIARLRDRAGLHGDATLEAIVARLRAIVDVMARGAERTAGIVQDLRVFSRVGETTPLPMDLHEGIEVSLRLLRPRWVDRIEIHKDYGTVPVLEGSASQINQVLMNLLGNACDAIAETGNVWIRTRSDATTVTVTVRDDGCGIAAEDVGRIFDPFFTTKPVGKGTGLGLAISASIVRDHGGTLTLANDGDRGATFVLDLPLLPRARSKAV